MTRNALGKGLSALIREPEAPPPAPSNSPSANPSPTPIAGAAAAVAPARAAEPFGSVLQIDIDLIDPSPHQPRTRFAQSALDELAQSIRSTGIIQPLVVRKRAARYQLLAGERRWRAAQLVSMHRVPVVIHDVPDEKAMEITLVENLQREDLNPIEQAQAFDRLIQEFHLTQEEAAERTGKERVTVANALRLLRLENPIREMVEDGRLTAGHARALLAIEDPPLRMETAKRAARGNLTVRHIERLATRTRKHRAAPQPATLDANTRAALDELQRVLGTRVNINPCSTGSPGQVVIEFYNEGDLHRLYQLIVGR
ncbi:MAG TPA: ParB/RepB/Spo0J family partition protein [Candidatus Limnocylindrales bacterium]|nr:ParB/RepB/Spo0J family partition protein [Candidatus Limnocylindrales bacterium]